MRGHQVRKNHEKFTWSIGFLGKIILRWQQKRSGLRGFKSEALTEDHKMQDKPSEDVYDFLKEGRKQAEQRLQKELARVKSMAQYPDARDQYRRILNVVTDIQGSKVFDYYFDFLLSFFEFFLLNLSCNNIFPLCFLLEHNLCSF